MTSPLRSLRLLLLLLSVLLAPPMAAVHALSHLAQPSHPAGGTQQKLPDESSAADKVCDICLALAQLDAALPAQVQAPGLRHSAPLSGAVADRSTAPRPLFAFVARGPPASI